MGRNNTLNTTELMTGKDGRLFVEFNKKNYFLAEINTYSVNMNVNTAEKQPVGSILVHRIPTGVTFDLTYTEMVVRDDLIMEPLLEAIQNGQIPVYNFQGVAYKPDGQEQRLAFNNAVPNGTFGIQTLTPGEVIEREQSFALNSIPSFISALASTYLS
ncbi:MAG: hypothetical protein IIZ93_01165 [Acidaminococcaceae bacterium]|jgi:hypothetical protein|nr:hypothetical protein [Acidaminococcaceae bacterium]